MPMLVDSYEQTKFYKDWVTNATIIVLTSDFNDDTTDRKNIGYMLHSSPIGRLKMKEETCTVFHPVYCI